jgi:hypothetical protein
MVLEELATCSLPKEPSLPKEHVFDSWSRSFGKKPNPKKNQMLRCRLEDQSHNRSKGPKPRGYF